MLYLLRTLGRTLTNSKFSKNSTNYWAKINERSIYGTHWSIGPLQCAKPYVTRFNYEGQVRTQQCGTSSGGVQGGSAFSLH